MKFALIALALLASSAFAANAKVPGVVGIWRVNMVTSTSTASTESTLASTASTESTLASTASTESTPASTASTESTPASIASTESTPASIASTESTPASIAPLVTSEDLIVRHPRFPEVVLHRHKRAEMDHENVFMCTGTLVTANWVLTTAECANAAVSDMPTMVTAGLDSVPPSGSDDKYWIEVLKKSTSGALAMLEVKQTLVTEVIPWSSAATAVGVSCTYTYWKQSPTKEITQISEMVTTKACGDDVVDSVCVEKTPGLRAICTGTSEGGVLVCNKKVVGIYGFAADNSCASDVTKVKLYDVMKKDGWLKTTSGASPLTLSALIGVLAVAISSIFN